jgi:hypothetical protein
MAANDWLTMKHADVYADVPQVTVITSCLSTFHIKKRAPGAFGEMPLRGRLAESLHQPSSIFINSMLLEEKKANMKIKRSPTNHTIAVNLRLRMTFHLE